MKEEEEDQGNERNAKQGGWQRGQQENRGGRRGDGGTEIMWRREMEKEKDLPRREEGEEGRMTFLIVA
jgi:hypothetical protein